MQFFMGLNDNFENVRSNNLSMDPLPSINKAYYLVQQAEKQKLVTSGNDMTNQETSGAYSVNRSSGSMTGNAKGQFNNSNGYSFGSGKGNSEAIGSYLEKKKAAKRAKMERKCTNYNQKGHTVDQCFKIHGYPEWFKELKGKDHPRTATAMSGMENSPLDYEASPTIDNALVNAVCQGVYKMMKANTPSLEF